MIFGKDVDPGVGTGGFTIEEKADNSLARLQLECDVTPIVEGEFHSFRKLFSRRGSKYPSFQRTGWIPRMIFGVCHGQAGQVIRLD